MRGFTLVELLVTITIIGLLAGITLGAIQAARQTAREANTKALITKLNHVIMQRYDSYQTRRVPIRTRGLQPGEAARRRVNAVRDLMRMEMPDRWTDVVSDPLNPASSLPAGLPLVLSNAPSLTQRYWEAYKRAWGRAQADPDVTVQDVLDWAPAECLYMIVMSSPEAAEQFSPGDIGDIDGDGLPEFHDGWGQPIRFIRWPRGFIPANGADTNLQTGIPYNPQNPETQPDPFDPRGVMEYQREFPIYPLIYSAGRDKVYDINIGSRDNKTKVHEYHLDGQGNLDPFAPDGDGGLIGRPIDAEGDGMNHHDNIHNHSMSQE